jgi:two-component system LytT family sensor kinase
LHLESDVTAAIEAAARRTLELSDATSIDLGKLPFSLWPSEIHEGEIAELDGADPLRSLLSLPDVELLIPIRAAGQVISVLAISPGPARRGLVTQEVSYLRSIAAQFGGRLDSLRLERDMVQRQSREAVLLQQLTAAELRALRAQINPHFLFNSLNTLANLIVTNPNRAEIMTLRLAKVFRHVLTHSSRPLTPIREEIEFLRTYLEIEEARFGNRLQVQIDVAADVALDYIPSLILQPVVENALKHGLAPKRGQGHLWISAQAQGDQICLKVEDDGIGLSPPGHTSNGHRGKSNGVGLTNIAQRLATLYQDRARFTLEPREAGGTLVTVLLPRGVGSNGYAQPHS